MILLVSDGPLYSPPGIRCALNGLLRTHKLGLGWQSPHWCTWRGDGWAFLSCRDAWDPSQEFTLNNQAFTCGQCVWGVMWVSNGEYLNAPHSQIWKIWSWLVHFGEREQPIPKDGSGGTDTRVQMTHINIKQCFTTRFNKLVALEFQYRTKASMCNAISFQDRPNTTYWTTQEKDKIPGQEQNYLRRSPCSSGVIEARFQVFQKNRYLWSLYPLNSHFSMGDLRCGPNSQSTAT